jgi:hypothetical protein
MNDEERPSDIELWRDADSLSSSWFVHAPETLKEQYRDSGAHPEQRSLFLRRMMEGEVASRVADGGLIAFGVQTSPAVEDHPRKMPTVLFDQGTAAIDWDEGTVVGLGRRFEAVRLVLVQKVTSVLGEGVSTPAASVPAPTKRGRRSFDALFEEAVEALMIEAEHFADWSQEKQGGAIIERAATLHPGLFPGAAKPGRSTVLRYLKDHPVRGQSRPLNPDNPE